MTQIELNPLAPREAIEFFRSKGLAPALQRFDWRDHWREEHARAFVVAKAMQDDVLETIRTDLLAALENGTTLEQFQSELTPKLKQFGWWGRQIERDPQSGVLEEVQLGSRHRLRTIFDTNMRTSHAAGKWARITRTKAAFPYLEYRQIDRESKRHDHTVYDGLIRPVDDPIWLRIFPPNGFFCGCYVRQMNDRMLAREGKSVSDVVALDFEERPNARTGKVERVPSGVHTGFDSNPGATWQDIEVRHKQSRLDLPDSHLAVDRSLTREIRERGIRDDFESLVVYDLDAAPVRPVIDYVRAQQSLGRSTVVPSRKQMSAMEDPRKRVVAIHNHPSSSSFSTADVRTFSNLPGLDQLVAVGHDGSIYRIGKTASTGEMPNELPNMLQELSHELLRSRVIMSDRVEYGPLVSHLMMNVLEQLGFVQYGAATSGRNKDAFDQNAALLDAAAKAILQGLAR